MAEKIFRGTFTAIVTPFNEDLSVDFDTFKKHIEHQINQGISGIVVSGSTGESATLTTKEKIALFETAIQQSNGRVPIIAGSGSNSTDSTIDLTTIAKQIGCSGSLLVAPYYNKPSQEGLYNHFREIAEAVDFPHIIYNVPGRSVVNISPEIQLKLAHDFENIVATKEASGDLEQIMMIIKNAPKDFSVLSGDDPLAVPTISVGGDGVVSVLSNYAPKEFGDAIKFALEGDFEKARELQYKLLKLIKLNFIEPNPVPAKTAMEILGQQTARFRMPLMKMTEEGRNILEEEIRNVGIKNIS